MDNVKKVPLAQRLETAGQKNGGCPVFFGINTEEYFFELSRAEEQIQEIYMDEIFPYSQDEYGLEMPLIGTTTAIGEQTAQLRNALLYQMLVEPFARLYALKNMIYSGSGHHELKDLLCEFGVKDGDFI